MGKIIQFNECISCRFYSPRKGKCKKREITCRAEFNNRCYKDLNVKEKLISKVLFHYVSYGDW